MPRIAIILKEIDRRLRNKAYRVGLNDKVFSIDAFIFKCTVDNPDLLEYKALSVKKTRFGDVEISNCFFAFLFRLEKPIVFKHLVVYVNFCFFLYSLLRKKEKLRLRFRFLQ